MNSERRPTLVIGLLLILAGAFFAVVQIVPSLRDLVNQQTSWVLIIEGVAVLLLILGVTLRTPDLAVPAVIVAGIGGILFYQASTGNWGSWSYLWTLIPGFSGVGMLLARLLGSHERYPVRASVDTIGTSLILFLIFGAFFGGFKILGPYWPLLLVAAGLFIGIRNLLRKN